MMICILVCRHSFFCGHKLENPVYAHFYCWRIFIRARGTNLVRIERKCIGPPSESVHEADLLEENLPSIALVRPAIAYVPG